MSSSDPSALDRRRRKLIYPRLQLKIVLVTLLVSALALVVNFQLNLAELWVLAIRYGENPLATELLAGLRDATFSKLLLSITLAVPLSAAVGIVYSFRVCGPLHRFRLHFATLPEGPLQEKLKLRRTDELQDVAEAVNAGLAPLVERLRKDSDLLRTVRWHLEQTDPSRRAESREAILATLEAAEPTFERWFPADVSPGGAGLAEAGGTAEVEEGSVAPVSSSLEVAGRE